jgi:hypothetical protein
LSTSIPFSLTVRAGKHPIGQHPTVVESLILDDPLARGRGKLDMGDEFIERGAHPPVLQIAPNQSLDDPMTRNRPPERHWPDCYAGVG